MNGPVFAWVIEHAASAPSTPLYWKGCVLGGDEWSSEHLDAVRFARQIDAEKVLRLASRRDGVVHRIAEHGWG